MVLEPIGKSDQFQHITGYLAAFGRTGVTGIQEWQLDVFFRRCPGQQIKILKHKTDPTIPNVGTSIATS
jgi:hypothetical protein